MSEIVPWIAGQADGIEGEGPNLNSLSARKREKRPLESSAFLPEAPASTFVTAGLGAHQFPGKEQTPSEPEGDGAEIRPREFQMEEERWEERRRAREMQRQEELDREADLRRYRGRTVKLLRRYLRTAIETGRLPSILGSAFFRSGVTSYGVVTFEDRVIFVHDMEICLEKLGEFSRQIIARYVLQEHNLEDTARLLHCDEKTIRRNVSMVLDDCSEILLKMGLLERLDSNWENSCQGGKSDEFFASDC
jgi:hypothetical protein